MYYGYCRSIFAQRESLQIQTIDKVAVCLGVEAYAVVEADEGWACRLDIEKVTSRLRGVRIPSGYLRDW